ncbi:MAG: 1-acyl-sn-glycerol-3-phosphate acyltransferase [Oscillospiraceae bacterium]|nr:1-acyl-sn-glycerol-3-phosphate acyltransferase [Oscillospiraceae bacterium]
MNSIGNFFYKILRYTVQLFFSLKYRMKIYNKDRIPKKLKGGYIVACNHQSYTDPPAIAAVIKGRFSFMAKDELFRGNPFFSLLIRMCGAFPVVRGAGDRSVIDNSVAFLKKGRILVIFPEGTRSKNGTIGRAKSGVALIAATANVPVLPVCIMYGLNGNKRNLDFAIGDLIAPEEINISQEGEGDRKELRRVSERIMNSIKQLQEQILRDS